MLRNETQERSWSADTGAGSEWGPVGWRAADNEESVAAAWPALLDQFAFGVAIVDGRRRLLYANRIAAAELRREICLRQARAVVEPVATGDLALLEKALGAAQTGRRSYLALGKEDSRTEIAVLPMPESGAPGSAAVALIFEKRVGSCGLGLYFYARTYQLTRGEHRALEALSEGLSVAEVAARLGCAVNTARTHVRNLLGKTGQRNLRTLVSRIGALPPVAARFLSCAEDGSPIVKT